MKKKKTKKKTPKLKQKLKKETDAKTKNVAAEPENVVTESVAAETENDAADGENGDGSEKNEEKIEIPKKTFDAELLKYISVKFLVDTYQAGAKDPTEIRNNDTLFGSLLDTELPLEETLQLNVIYINE